MERKSAQPNEEDAGGHGENAGDRAKGNALLQCHSAENQDHDGRRPTSDRIDDD